VEQLGRQRRIRAADAEPLGIGKVKEIVRVHLEADTAFGVKGVSRCDALAGSGGGVPKFSGPSVK